MEGVAEKRENGLIRFIGIMGSENEQVDNLSNLPDSILLHILSFLPMEEAVKTVLHRRFGDLWTSLQTLNFDARAFHDFSDARDRLWFTSFVNQVLLLHECPTISKFSLKFGTRFYFEPQNIKPDDRHPKPLEQDFSSNIGRWIDFAIRKKVQVLDLGILAHESSSSRFDYELPDNVLTCDSLKELMVVNIGLKQLGKIHMKMLKSLSLTTIMLDDAMAEGILSGCPLLERLSIIKCYGLYKLNCKSIHLKKLTVDIGEYELPGLEISGPNLTSVHISGIEARIHVRNLLSLDEATLDLCSEGHGYKHAYIGILVEKLHHANTFTITDWCIQVLSFLSVIDVPCPSSRRTTLVLNTMLTKWHLTGITELLRSSPNLERLNIHVETDVTVTDEANDLQLGLREYDGEVSGGEASMLKDYEDNYLNSQEPFDCLRNHLKYVKISGRLSNKSLHALVRFLLRRSKVLEKMVISSYSSQLLSEESLKFFQMLSRCRKASDRAVVLFN